jgi:SprT protein
MLDGGLHAHAEALLADLMCQAPLKRRPKIEWRSYRVTAGVAYYRAGVIGLSKLVLKTPEQLSTTLIHEYAHLLAYERHGRAGAGHGVLWKSVMIELGQDPRRTHNYEVQRNQPRQEVGYRCIRCGITVVRKRRLPKGRRYVHARCGGDLRLSYVRDASIKFEEKSEPK